ncbi:MAG: phosphatidylglycerol lysyltransferase domain-containing protein [Planctomycetota bacterium]|jgi:hypothetical protein
MSREAENRPEASLDRGTREVAGVELNTLALADGAAFKSAFQEHRKAIWCYYFPFLFCYGRSKAREMLWHCAGDSLCVFLLRERRDGPRIDLFVPPLPFCPEVTRSSFELMNQFNGDRSARVLWADERDASDFAATGGFEVSLKEKEYMYDPRRVSELQGHEYKDLRKRTRRFQRANDHVWRELRPGDTDGCMELLRKWKRTQGRKSTHLLDMAYTRAAIELYAEFERKDLSGWGVLVDGEVKAFCMGGEMSDTVANFFAAKSDPDIYGLSEFSRWCFCREMVRFELINDASDLGLPGLKQFKRKFRPVAMLEVFTVNQGPG